MPTGKEKPKETIELSVGDPVPAFSLPATKVAKISNTSLKGAITVLYFYPKDDTSGCTAQACAFQEGLPQFSKLGVAVVGISKDSLESHEKFAKKYKLSFPLASDVDGDVCAKFGVWKQKSMYGRTYMGIERSTFLIDSKGKILYIWRKVKVPGHYDEVKAAIKGLI
jgi:peroxiredoxin Q/BCP